MSFVFPWALWGLLLVPLLVLAFLFKLQSSRAVVSALHLWEKSAARDGLLARFHKLRRWLSLLIALLLLLLCLAAASRPSLFNGATGDQLHVLVIDRSSATSAVDADGISLFDQALERAAEVLRKSPDDGRTILAAADVRLRILGNLGASRKELLGILAGLKPTGVEGDLMGTTRQALQLLPGYSTVLLVTAKSSQPGLDDERLFLELVDDSNLLPNLAIREFGVKRRLSDPSTLEIFAAMVGDQDEAEMDLLVNDSLIDVITLNLRSNGWSYELAVADLPADVAEHRLTLRLKNGGAIRFDDFAHASVPVLAPIRVLLVSEGSRYLEAALGADASLQVEMLQPDQFTPSMARAVDVVLLDRFPADALPEEGNILWIQPSMQDDASLAVITEMNPEHPILAQVVLDRARIPVHRDATAELQNTGWESTALVSSQDVALVSLASRGEQRLVRFGIDLDASDLPARVAFPLLIRQSLQWLAAAASSEISSLRAGTILPLAPGEMVTFQGAMVSKPGFVELLEPGFYSTSSQTLAVSTLPAMATAGAAEQSNADRPYSRTSSGLDWRWFAGAALLLLALEWWAYHRRQLE